MTTNLSDVMYLPTYNQRIPGTDIEICGKNQVVTLNESEPPILYHTIHDLVWNDIFTHKIPKDKMRRQHNDDDCTHFESHYNRIYNLFIN